ncbi:YfhE family protein [Paenisporosarcina sp. TG20]|uniref:YfhE family protein n=1 Tax=Paenisporosarcina sp. TG20 TaxID=1211706 RepID=UPI00030A8A32
MSERKPPHQQMSEENNGLSDAQEVLYNEEFNKADKASGLKVGNGTNKKTDDKVVEKLDI